METQTPDWLTVTALEQSPAQTIGEPIARTRAELALMEQHHQAAFEPILDRITLGHSLKDILDDRPHDSYPIHKGALIRWIRSDPDRLQRYRDAQEIGTELIEDEMIEISDGKNMLEDVARSKLRIDTRKDVLGFRNRKRYGKDAPVATPFAQGAITINIGQVEVPVRSAQTSQSAPTISEVIDV